MSDVLAPCTVSGGHKPLNYRAFGLLVTPDFQHKLIKSLWSTVAVPR